MTIHLLDLPLKDVIFYPSVKALLAKPCLGGDIPQEIFDLPLKESMLNPAVKKLLKTSSHQAVLSQEILDSPLKDVILHPTVKALFKSPLFNIDISQDSLNLPLKDSLFDPAVKKLFKKNSVKAKISNRPLDLPSKDVQFYMAVSIGTAWSGAWSGYEEECVEVLVALMKELLSKDKLNELAFPAKRSKHLSKDQSKTSQEEKRSAQCTVKHLRMLVADSLQRYNFSRYLVQLAKVEKGHPGFIPNDFNGSRVLKDVEIIKLFQALESDSIINTLADNEEQKMDANLAADLLAKVFEPEAKAAGDKYIKKMAPIWMGLQKENTEEGGLQVDVLQWREAINEFNIEKDWDGNGRPYNKFAQKLASLEEDYQSKQAFKRAIDETIKYFGQSKKDSFSKAGQRLITVLTKELEADLEKKEEDKTFKNPAMLKFIAALKKHLSFESIETSGSRKYLLEELAYMLCLPPEAFILYPKQAPKALKEELRARRVNWCHVMPTDGHLLSCRVAAALAEISHNLLNSQKMPQNDLSSTVVSETREDLIRSEQKSKPVYESHENKPELIQEVKVLPLTRSSMRQQFFDNKEVSSLKRKTGQIDEITLQALSQRSQDLGESNQESKTVYSDGESKSVISQKMNLPTVTVASSSFFAGLPLPSESSIDEPDNREPEELSAHVAQDTDEDELFSQLMPDGVLRGAFDQAFNIPPLPLTSLLKSESAIPTSKSTPKDSKESPSDLLDKLSFFAGLAQRIQLERDILYNALIKQRRVNFAEKRKSITDVNKSLQQAFSEEAIFRDTKIKVPPSFPGRIYC